MAGQVLDDVDMLRNRTGGIMAVSEARIRATRKYERKNPEKNRRTKYRSTAKTFIRHYADQKDIEDLRELLNQRESELVADIEDNSPVK